MKIKQMMLRLPIELYDKLKYKADRMGVSVNHIMLMTVWDIIEQESNTQ
jgi:predicted HicB family RNase H-like nuclease